jgi:gamma-glutamylcyclotransferase (GGCT)/AIG2-like uncharacterized protein YtfP
MGAEHGGDYLGLPSDPAKVLFVYGNLKPGELGYNLIADHVLGSAQQGEVQGHIWLRDGVPLAYLTPGSGTIDGYILTLAPNGYDNIGKFEPATYYRWSTQPAFRPPDLKSVSWHRLRGLHAIADPEVAASILSHYHLARGTRRTHYGHRGPEPRRRSQQVNETEIGRRLFDVNDPGLTRNCPVLARAVKGPITLWHKGR